MVFTGKCWARHCEGDAGGRRLHDFCALLENIFLFNFYVFLILSLALIHNEIQLFAIVAVCNPATLALLVLYQL